jgi:excisionase family DNA binding protein|tara:strand:+ start:628 stop:807 length:180 start_codon:yes stop_codon:yes gene_type:complete
MNLETNWMSKSELKDYLGFSMGKIEMMMKSNQLPYYKVGKNVKFKRDLVEQRMENYLVK